MMAVQNRHTRITTPAFATSMSAKATIAPIVLSSDQCQGNQYLAGKNTFLEVYTDENKANKRSAYARSASADSHFKSDRSTQSTATSTNRSSSPSSNRSLLSTDNEIAPNAEWQSPNATPRDKEMIPNAEWQSPNATPRGRAYDEKCEEFQWYHDANYDLMATWDATSRSWDAACSNWETMYDVSTSAGYPMTMMPWITPMAPCVMGSQKGMQPQVVKPRKTKGESASHVKPAKKTDLKKDSKVAVTLADDVTTLMIRGIPCNFSQESFISHMDEAGLKGKYNFFYLPRDSKASSNLGHALINLVDQESAALCAATFTGVRLTSGRSKKPCTVTPAEIQGLERLWKEFPHSVVSLWKPMDSGKPWFSWAYAPQTTTEKM